MKKMEVLDLKPVKGKTVIVFLIKKQQTDLGVEESLILKRNLMEYPFKFSTIDLPNDELEHFKRTRIAGILNEFNLPCYIVDIPEYAKGYLDSELHEKQEQITDLENEYKYMTDRNSLKAQNLKSWIDYLLDELRKKEEFMELKLKPQWIAKKILDIVKYYEDKTVFMIHFTIPELLNELKQIFEELGIEVVIGDIVERFEPKLRPLIY